MAPNLQIDILFILNVVLPYNKIGYFMFLSNVKLEIYSLRKSGND